MDPERSPCAERSGRPTGRKDTFRFQPGQGKERKESCGKQTGIPLAVKFFWKDMAEKLIKETGPRGMAVPGDAESASNSPEIPFPSLRSD